MDIRSFVKKQDIIGNMMTYEQIVAILENLYNVITHEIPGDIVELGCNIGTTTMFIQKLLDELKCDKVIHVYDSWKGLPKMNLHDMNESIYKFKEGSCTTSKQSFINTQIQKTHIKSLIKLKMIFAMRMWERRWIATRMRIK